jgi:mono/diheme cytochrome c family protein
MYRIIVLLVALVQASGPSAQSSGTASAARTANGKRLFEAKACYQCHGWQGQWGLAGPRLAQTKLTVEGFRNILRNPPPSQMPPYRPAVLTDTEAADLLAYIQSFPAPRPANTILLLRTP